MQIRYCLSIVLSAVILTAVATGASAREDTRTMTCSAAKALIVERGAATLATSTFLYYRFVANRSLCDRTQVVRAAYAPTSDNPQCAIGFRCATAPGGNGNR